MPHAALQATDPDGVRLKANQEKNAAAASSVVAAVGLTAMKLVVGLSTGSLGILSEAAHSALDLVAALVTWFSVRISGRPPDSSHNYGHGKVENLSALVETLLLLLTCAWIIYEAFRRIFFAEVHVEVSVWAFAVMGISIVVDYSRSRMLLRAAKKHNSQALEADGLHFSTDMWSSSVVIIGLALMWAQRRFGWPEIWANADAVAALGVACIVIWVSIQLGKRTVEALLDAAPPGLREEVAAAVASVPEVLAVRQVRLRQVGPHTFTDVDIAVRRDASFSQSHDIAAAVEQQVRQMLPQSDVVVHVDPSSRADETSYQKVRAIAAAHGLGAHSIHVHDIRGKVYLEFHTEVPESLNVEQAHEAVSSVEAALREEIPDLADVITHIEPAARDRIAVVLSREESAQVEHVVQRLADEYCGCGNWHRVLVRDESGMLSISLHCQMAGSTSIRSAHELTERLEAALRESIPNVGQW
jgi:cation diffusion facilitator family transporter